MFEAAKESPQFREHGSLQYTAAIVGELKGKFYEQFGAAGFAILISNNVPNTTTKYKIIAGHAMATTYVEQVLDVQTYKPEKRFGDAVKGLHVYGAKVVRPTALACLIANKS